MKFRQVLEKMEQLNEFEHLVKHAEEKELVEKDVEILKTTLEHDYPFLPTLMNLRSYEVMRDIICLMQGD